MDSAALPAAASHRRPAERRVSATIRFRAGDRTADALAIQPASGYRVDERLDILIDGEPVETTDVIELHGGRMTTFITGAADVDVQYSATVHGEAAPAAVRPLDALVYTRPSRYCESDTLTPFARDTFRSRDAGVLALEVSDWVFGHLAYVSGSSVGTDGATETLESRMGVCRDFSHLTIALLRALDVPARAVSVYAPGLSPMDFHAVSEVLVAGRWFVVDSTRLAPRSSMVRIATGRDSADTAFLTTALSDIELTWLTVMAVADELPRDDPGELVELG